METFDRARFLKVLALAENDIDGEALAAIRKAAALARAAGLSLGEAAANGAADYNTHSHRLQIDRLETQLKNADRERARLDRERARLATRVEELQAELEGYRDPLDWQDLADRFYARHRAAKGLAYRAAVNKLTIEDRAVLREFARTKKRRTA
jgi:predicted RNase H-like nuclease (RuvC/YqgF family)